MWIGIAVAAVLAVFVIVGAIANGTNKIYPNVYVKDVKVGGMTQKEADKALTNVDFSESKDSITVELPEKITFRITAAEAGTALSQGNASEIAYHYGREGGFLRRTVNYISCLFGKKDIAQEKLAANEEAIYSLVQENADKLAKEEMQNSYEVDQTKKVLRLTKGAVAHNIDVERLTKQLCKAFEEKNYFEIVYEDSAAQLQEIDFDMIYQNIYVEPQEAHFDKEKFEVVEGVTGISFNLPAAKRLFSLSKAGDVLEIPLEYTKPTVDAEQLREMLFRDTLASVTTSLYGSSSNRINNITLAAKAVNGCVLLPDEVFSYNDTLGARTKEKGYLEAGAYVGGKTVQDVGGGICQLSSSIYYCTLYSNLETVTRECHMFLIDYLPMGTDATVNWGTLDFQFRNSSQYPLQINCYVDGNQLYVEILGTKTDEYTYEIESVVTDKIEYETKYELDKTLKPGEEKVETPGHTGYVCDTYRYVYDKNGELVRKEFISTSDYSKQDRIIKVSKLPDASPSPSVSPSVSPSAVPSSEPSEEPSAVPSLLPQ